MEPFNVKSKEALAWVAGFFDGEGSVNVARYEPTGSITGHMMITQKVVEPLEFMRAVLIAHGLEIRNVRCRESQNTYELAFSGPQGAEVLQLLLPYLRHPKQIRRAELYLKVFPPGSKGVRMREQRTNGYNEWLKSRNTELLTV